MATSGFSPAQTTTSTHHPHSPSSSAQRLNGFLTLIFTSLTHLASKLKSQIGRTSPRKIMSNVSHKAMKMVHRRNDNNQGHERNVADRDDALWQRAILMGDKCQPLDFSGVIYYDQTGKQRSEPLLKSPRTPLPSYFQARPQK